MVGSVVLFLIAVLAFAVGLPLWVFAWFSENPERMVNGGILVLVGTVALSGALIIDGIRYYATRLTLQMNWMLKPSGSVGRPSTDIKPGESAGGRGALSRYHVIGVDQSTGLETELVVQVADETEALKAGERRGMEVQRVALAS